MRRRRRRRKEEQGEILKKGGFDVLLRTPSTVHFLLKYGSMGKRVGEIMRGTFGKSLLMGLHKTLAKLHSSLYYQCGGENPKNQKPKTKNQNERTSHVYLLFGFGVG